MSIAAGDSICALTRNGAVQCWGSGNALGNLSPFDSIQPVIDISDAIGITAGEAHTCALLNGGSIKCWDYNGDGELGTGTTKDSLVPVTVLGF